jgi:hypothetical protein
MTAKRNRKTHPLVCTFCGRDFMGTYKQKWNHNRCCSLSCKAKRRVGPLNSNWREGTKTRSRDGRVFLYIPEHSKAVKGYVLRYRIVAEKALGRPLRDDEVVHHIDGNTSNDSADNLQVMTKSEHSMHHAQERKHRGGLVAED